jgi:protein-S-isoprenylcysteine O-methyltransferase Ste14
MGGVASVLYGVIFRRAFFGATYCAVAPLFRKTIRRPSRFGLLRASWTALSLPAGRLSFTTVATVYIVSGIYLGKHDLIALFGDQYGRYRQQMSLLAPIAERQSVDGKVAMRQTKPDFAGYVETIRRRPLED